MNKQIQEEYFNGTIRNDTQSSIDCSRLFTFNDELIHNPSNYKVNVNKLQVPANLIKSFIINDQTKYTLKYALNTSSQTPNEYKEIESQVNLYDDNEFEIYTPEDFLENVNKSSSKCYRNLLYNLKDKYDNYLEITGSDNWDLSFFSSKKREITINVPTDNNRRRKLGYLKVEIKLEEDDVNNNDLYEVYIKSPNTGDYPDGQTCLLFSQARTDFNNNLVFEEASLNNISKTEHNDTLKGDYSPLESFIKFNNEQDCTGDWKLIINSKGSDNTRFTGNIEYKVHYYFLPDYEEIEMGVPNRSPFIYINDENKLVMNVQNRIVKSNFSIEMSPELHNILFFRATTTSNNNRRLTIPPTTLNTSNGIDSLEIIQPQTSTYKLTDIGQILIITRLPINAEMFSDIDVKENILMSLDYLPTKEKDLILFDTTSQEIRSYSLLSNAPITNIYIEIKVSYKSFNETRTVQLHQNDSCLFQLKFRPII